MVTRHLWDANPLTAVTSPLRKGHQDETASGNTRALELSTVVRSVPRLAAEDDPFAVELRGGLLM